MSAASMRSEEEIREASGALSFAEGPKSGCLDWKGDNYNYGRLVGTIEALNWVLGESDSSPHFDFENFVRKNYSDFALRRIDETCSALSKELRRRGVAHRESEVFGWVANGRSRYAAGALADAWQTEAK